MENEDRINWYSIGQRLMGNKDGKCHLYNNTSWCGKCGGNEQPPAFANPATPFLGGIIDKLSKGSTYQAQVVTFCLNFSFPATILNRSRGSFFYNWVKEVL
jgi:hypothetical protein